MSAQVQEREWDYLPDDDPCVLDEPHILTLGWHPRSGDETAEQARDLCASFELYAGCEIVLRPILCRWATEVECRINGWEDGTFTSCTTRAKHPFPMWQIERAQPKHPSRGEPG